jgi:hypothetical protein
LRRKDAIRRTRVTCLGVTNTRQDSRPHDKRSEQRQALYSGAEGSSLTLFHSPLLNTLSRHPRPPNIHAHASRFGPPAAASLSARRRGQFLLSCHILLSMFSILHAVFSFHLHPIRVLLFTVSTSLYLIFADSIVRYMFHTSAGIRCSVITQFEANSEHSVKLQRRCKSCLRIILAVATNRRHTPEKRITESRFELDNFRIEISTLTATVQVLVP